MLLGRVTGLVVVSLIAGAGVSGTAMAGSISDEFALNGDIATPGVYDLGSLEALPATTLTATYLAGKPPVPVTELTRGRIFGLC